MCKGGQGDPLSVQPRRFVSAHNARLHLQWKIDFPGNRFDAGLVGSTAGRGRR